MPVSSENLSEMVAPRVFRVAEAEADQSPDVSSRPNQGQAIPFEVLFLLLLLLLPIHLESKLHPPPNIISPLHLFFFLSLPFLRHFDPMMQRRGEIFSGSHFTHTTFLRGDDGERDGAYVTDLSQQPTQNFAEKD